MSRLLSFVSSLGCTSSLVRQFDEYCRRYSVVALSCCQSFGSRYGLGSKRVGMCLGFIPTICTGCWYWFCCCRGLEGGCLSYCCLSGCGGKPTSHCCCCCC